MGHVQYFLQYKDQPVVFRDGANPGNEICISLQNQNVYDSGRDELKSCTP